MNRNCIGKNKMVAHGVNLYALWDIPEIQRLAQAVRDADSRRSGVNDARKSKNLTAYKQAKIKLLINDFRIPLSAEDKGRIMGAKNDLSVDRIARSLFLQSCEA